MSRFRAIQLLAITATVACLAGCGANQGVFTGPDGRQYVRTPSGQVIPYAGNGYGDPYGTGATGYGSTGYDSSGYGAANGSTGYDSSGYGAANGSTYTDTSSYGTGATGSYTDTTSYGTGSYGGSTYGTSTYGGGYGVTPGASAAPSAAPVASLPVNAATDAGLSAFVTNVAHSGLLLYGKVVAKVQVENDGNVSLSGRLRVAFTKDGHPSAFVTTRTITLRPGEKQVLTFTQSGGGINDAEATIEPIQRPQGSGSTVSDRK